MKKILVGFFALSLLFISPEVFGQETFEEIGQKSVVIKIDDEGNVKVVHEVKNSKDPKQLTFVDGTVSNVKFTKLGIDELFPESDGAKKIVILPNQGNFFVSYDLKDAVFEKTVYGHGIFYIWDQHLLFSLKRLICYLQMNVLFF